METLDTVKSYVEEVRVLLLDVLHPHRYKDHQIVAALNTALLDMRRIRADLFIHRHGNHVPRFESADAEETVPIEPQFRLVLVYSMAGQVLLRDEEDVQDARANSFRMMANAMLTGMPVPAMQGGTPPPGSPQR